MVDHREIEGSENERILRRIGARSAALIVDGRDLTLVQPEDHEIQRTGRHLVNREVFGVPRRQIRGRRHLDEGQDTGIIGDGATDGRGAIGGYRAVTLEETHVEADSILIEWNGLVVKSEHMSGRNDDALLDLLSGHDHRESRAVNGHLVAAGKGTLRGHHAGDVNAADLGDKGKVEGVGDRLDAADADHDVDVEVARRMRRRDGLDLGGGPKLRVCRHSDR